jgi:hypothetical protein
MNTTCFVKLSASLQVVRTCHSPQLISPLLFATQPQVLVVFEHGLAAHSSDN